MSLRTFVPWTLLALAVLAIGWFTVATRDLAARIGRQQIALRQGAAELTQSRDRLLAARDREVELDGHIASLERQLQAALQQQHLVGDMVAARAEQERREREEREAARRAANAPMPEGVRLCLMALRDCLRADSFYGLRFVRAGELVDKELRDVELIDADPERLTTVLYLAGKVTLHLDRSSGQVTFRFFDGQRRVGSRIETLPDEGLPVCFSPVSGPLWEARLPFLIQAEGQYPADDSGSARDLGDTLTRRVWLDRLNALLAKAGNDPKLVIGAIGGVKDSRFLQVSIQGYDRRSLLTMAGTVEAMTVEVDAATGIVQLRLCDGVLHQRGGDSTISHEGFRMLLQDLTPQQASDAMLGMVVRR